MINANQNSYSFLTRATVFYTSLLLLEVMMKKVGLTNKNSGSITKSKAEKRKIPSQIMAQEIKTKDVDVGKVKKVPLKADLVVELKSLHKEHEALKLENTKNCQTIQTLEKKVFDLEQQTDQNHRDAGTESVQETNTEKCEFIGEDEYDLDAHVFSEECEQHFTCYYCGMNFYTKKDLMIHRKIEHEQKVKPCRNFSGGGCELKDEDCWYLHSDSSCQEKTLTLFTCHLCDKVFESRRDFMHHRKKEHVRAIPHCNNANSGKCLFGAENCWFQHSEIDKRNEHENNAKQMEISIMMKLSEKYLT